MKSRIFYFTSLTDAAALRLVVPFSLQVILRWVAFLDKRIGGALTPHSNTEAFLTLSRSEANSSHSAQVSSTKMRNLGK